MEGILRQIESKNLAQVYVLYGAEPYYLKKLSKAFEESIVPEDARDFNRHICYGKDTSIGEVIQLARALPMFSDKTVVLVREAQHLAKQMQQLELYLDNPNPDCVLVLVLHQKSIDKRLKIFKRLEKEQVLFESKPIYENKAGQFLDQLLSEKGITLSLKAKQLLLFSLNTDLERYERELDKLRIAELTTNSFEVEHIEKYIGIHRNYNVFELTKSISEAQTKRTADILGYFSRNIKEHPPLATLAVLTTFFIKVFRYHSLTNKSEASRVLGISPYFLTEYQKAAQNYPMKRLTLIVEQLKQLDLKCKGVGGSPNTSDSQIYQELLYTVRT